MSERAHARVSDPGTSHAAADAVTPGLPHLQQLVETFALDRPDGFTDPDLTAAFPYLGQSTLRTRRSELGERNIILSTGRKTVPEGHTQQHTVWTHRNFVADPPPITEPAAPKGSDDPRGEKLAMAAKLDAYATTARGEGRSFLAGELTEAARLLRI